jgi:hypothetical protein
VTRLARAILLSVLVVFASAPTAQESLLPLVQEVRATYGPAPSDPELCEALNTIAWRANGNRADGPWGLSRKASGTRCVRSDGTPLAHDILHHAPSNRLFDVFAAAGAAADPQWAEVAHHQDPGRPWVAPISPTQPEPRPDCAACLDALSAERARSSELRAALDEAARVNASMARQVAEAQQTAADASGAHDNAVAQRDELQRRLDALLAEPAPRCEAKLLGVIKVPCRVIR